MSISIFSDPPAQTFTDVESLVQGMTEQRNRLRATQKIPIDEMSLQADGTLQTPEGVFSLSEGAFKDVAVLGGLGSRVARKYLGEELDEVILYAVEARFAFLGKKKKRILFYPAMEEGKPPLAISVAPATYSPITHPTVLDASLKSIPDGLVLHRADLTLDTIKLSFLDKESNVGISKEDQIIWGVRVLSNYRSRKIVTSGDLERLVCTNGLTVSEKICGDVIPHNKRREKVMLNGNLSEAIIKAHRILSELTPRIGELQGSVLDQEKYDELVDLLRRVPGIKKKDAVSILEEYEPGQENPRNMYDLFNKITEMGRDAKREHFGQHLALERIGGWFLSN